MQRRQFCSFAAAAAAWPIAGPVRSQETTWPTRPITLVVPLAAGSPTDIMARSIAAELVPRLGQQVVIENKPGGGALIATTAVQQAKGDGYTYLFTISSHTINAAVRKTARYEPIKDFTPVGLIGAVPHVLVVGKDVPAGNLSELVALAKSRPGKLSYGSAGIGISTRMNSEETFASLAGLDLVHVPYKGGSSEARQDLFAGRIDMLFDVLGNAVPFIKEGRLKPIGVAQARRSKLAPELPRSPRGACRPST